MKHICNAHEDIRTGYWIWRRMSVDYYSDVWKRYMESVFSAIAYFSVHLATEIVSNGDCFIQAVQHWICMAAFSQVQWEERVGMPAMSFIAGSGFAE